MVESCTIYFEILEKSLEGKYSYGSTDFGGVHDGSSIFS